MSKNMGKLQAQVVLTHEAVSLIKGNDGQFKLVLIKFNPETGDVGPLEIKGVGSERMEAQARFKVAAGTRFPTDFVIKENE